ncbi:hypothetical protein AB0903_28025 [Streptomyces sp. NPDC048389]|uniref:hypothetical protein n=1 Tax=Streptomyces sp. NPDC048389 TaxID=3154622 RepID=UPI0034545372
MPIDMPDTNRVPEGPHRQLLLALHELYRDAGRPGIKRTSDTIQGRNDLPGTISHEGISKILHGTVLPQHWQKLESLVRQYLTWSVDQPRPEHAADTVRKILGLWHDATEQRTRQVPTPEDVVRRALELPEDEAAAFITAAADDPDTELVPLVVALMPSFPKEGLGLLTMAGGTHDATDDPHLADLIADLQAYPTAAWHGHDPFFALLRRAVGRGESGTSLVKLLLQQGNTVGAQAYLKTIALRTDPFHAAHFVAALNKTRGLATAIDEFLKAIAQHMPRPLAEQVPAHLKKLGRRREERTLSALLAG